MIWCMCNSLNFEAASQENLDLRLPFIDYYLVTNAPDPNNKIPYILQSVDLVKNMKRPRFIKSHLPWDLLPKQIRNFEKRPKIIHVARNLKDVCVSYFHHNKLFHEYTGDMTTFATLFMAGYLLWTPVIGNILSYWKYRDESNILFLKYEDMKKDLTLIIKEVAGFLNVNITYNQMVKLINHLSFDSMKKNKSINQSERISFLTHNNQCIDPNAAFIRKSIVGSHKAEMSDEVIAAIDKWTEEEVKNTGLTL